MRFVRALLTAGLFLYLAIIVTPLLRLGDALIGMARGVVWAPFDASSFFDGAHADALWGQWFWLWTAAMVFWWVLAPALVVAAKRMGASVDENAAASFGSVLVPGVASMAIGPIIGRVLTGLEPWLGENAADVRAHHVKLCQAVPQSFGVAAMLQFFLLIGAFTFHTARTEASDGEPVVLANVIVLIALHVPLMTAPVARLVQLWQLRRILADLRTGDVVRAANAEPVGG